MHPARYFIWYLMASTYPNRMSPNRVREFLIDRRLFDDMATDAVLDQLYQHMERSIPTDFRSGSRTHAESLSFMRAARILDAMTETASFARATDLLSRSQLRAAIEDLLLSKMAPKVVAAYVNKKFKTRYREEEIAVFRHYFFSLEDVPQHLLMNSLVLRSNNPLRTQRVALAGDELFALWQLKEDIQPEIQQIKDEVLTQAWMRVKELREMPTTVESVKMLGALTRVILTIEEAKNNSDHKMKEINERLRALTQKRREADFKDPASMHLVGGDSSKESFKVHNPKGLN